MARVFIRLLVCGFWVMIFGSCGSGPSTSQGHPANFSPAPQPSSVPIAFSDGEKVADVPQATRLAWGPDGRLYVGALDGRVHILTIDEDNQVVGLEIIQTLQSVANPNILGLAFSPFDPPNPPKLYVAHGELYANGGDCFTGALSPYSGQVSVLSGPDFSTLTPVITGLPVSNHDHGINGLEFDAQANLYIAIGGNTNAGVPSCPLGGLPESPLSGAIIKAPIYAPAFNGVVTYVETATGLPNNDQVFGDLVDLSPGVGLAPHAVGLRNAFDLLWTTKGRLLGTENGANEGSGPLSTGPTTEGGEPATALDELLALVDGHYYGHPNRNRGRTDARQNIYHTPEQESVLNLYTAPLGTLPSSSDGIDEYRANTFGGKMRGQLLVEKFSSSLLRVALDPNGFGVKTVETVSDSLPGLDVLAGPGGSLWFADFIGNAVRRATPLDAPSVLAVFDLFPWRALPTGQVPFVISGAHFGTLADTSVKFGDQPATLSSVSPTRIRGLVPAASHPSAALLDLVVESGGHTVTLTQAFRYLLPAGAGLGTWTSGAPMPIHLAEISAAAINGVLFVIGENDTFSGTEAYDLARGVWTAALATRPFVGDHHACEVINGRVYLFGGLGGGTEGQVQSYDPLADSWSIGTPAPFATGSAASVLIHGKVYYAGGVTGDLNPQDAAVYDPSTDTWSAIAPLPYPRHHTAAATDGERFYIFGGRVGPNLPNPGFNTVQIYDPLTDTWETSLDPGSTIPPMPTERSGMGKAVFFDGEFYIIGGETTTSGMGVDGVFDEVDVYNPLTKSWRIETKSPSPLHGIFPVAYDGKIYLVGGDAVMGHGAPSSALYVFSR